VIQDLNWASDGNGEVISLTSWEESQFAGKDGSLAKLDTTLRNTFGEYVAQSARGDHVDFQPSNSLVQVSGALVHISAAASTDAATLLADLESMGLESGSTYGLRVSGWLPLDAVDDLAALESVQFVTASLLPWSNVGATDSQGDPAMNADDARSLFGVDGSGVTVGVISNSFDTSGTGSYAADVASGDLPPGVNVLADYAGSTDEGRGMMQLIHDVAPGANLAFHTAYSSEVEFANGILALANAGADVIVDDVMYLEEPMFQDGIIAQAVDTVVANSVAYFSAAGNAARKSYESPFVDSGLLLEVDGQSRGILHDFDPGAGTDYLQSIYIPWFSSIYIAFQWDEPFYSVSGGAGSANDLDIYITNAEGTEVVAASVTRNIGGDPVEVLQFTGIDLFGQYNLMIANYGGPIPGLMKYIVYDAGFSPSILNEYATASSTTFGHANAAGAEAVGAAFYGDTPVFGQNPPLLESFSSAGGTPILFDTAGNRLPIPEIREKVEIVAPDGANTTFFPAGNDTDGDGFPNFYGTSAAAPHAAAVAALMLQLNPSLTPAEVYSTLESTAIDMDVPGFDNNTGYGLIQADLALAAVPTGPRLSVSIADTAINENGGSTTATVRRWNSDTSSPLIVSLTSSDTSEATVPGTVTILAGASSASFTITGVDDDLLDGAQTVTITATAISFLAGSDSVAVTDNEPQFLSQWATTVIAFSSEWFDPFNPIPNAWGSVQALGAPNTFQYGDHETAWSASTPDGNGVEYITLGYATPVFATGGIVRETYGNGFVTKLEVREVGSNTFHTVWTGTDPSLPGTPVSFDVSWPQTAFLVDALRVTTNSRHNSDINVSGEGWEAIDAVQLRGWDNPPPASVTITANDPAAGEAGANPGQFTITRTDSNGELTVFFSVDATSTAGDNDYLESLTGSVLFLDGQSSKTISITPVDDVEAEGDETLTLTLNPGANYLVGSPNTATVTIADDDLVTTDAFAVSEMTVFGTITSGSYLSTYSSNDVYEEITEVHSGGKPNSRRSFLEHKWTFNVDGGDPVTFYVEAVRTNSGEGDTFVFAYSTDGANYTDMVTVTKTIDDDAYQTFSLPVGTDGTVYVRVRDSDQSTAGHNILDTIFVDQMFIRSSNGGPVLPQVTLTATDPNAAEQGQDAGTFTITRIGDTTGDLTVYYSVDPSSTASSSDYVEVLSGSVVIGAGSSSATITLTPVNDGAPEIAETIVLRLNADPNSQPAYVIGSPSTDAITITDNDGGGIPTDNVAIAEETVRGTVTAGNYVATFTSDNGYEVIQERESAGKPGDRYSLLDHRWTFNVSEGSTVTFFVEAFHSFNTEGDDFVFAYSTDNINYTNMVIVSKTTDDNLAQSFTLPATLVGTVYVRVLDMDRTPGKRTLDAVYIDHMFIRSVAASSQSFVVSSQTIHHGPTVMKAGQLGHTNVVSNFERGNTRDQDMWLVPLVPVDAVRVLHDAADEETDWLDEELLGLVGVLALDRFQMLNSF
jgi:hypothetical protein